MNGTLEILTMMKLCMLALRGLFPAEAHIWASTLYVHPSLYLPDHLCSIHTRRSVSCNHQHLLVRVPPGHPNFCVPLLIVLLSTNCSITLEALSSIICLFKAQEVDAEDERTQLPTLAPKMSKAMVREMRWKIFPKTRMVKARRTIKPWWNSKQL